MQGETPEPSVGARRLSCSFYPRLLQQRQHLVDRTGPVTHHLVLFQFLDYTQTLQTTLAWSLKTQNLGHASTQTPPIQLRTLGFRGRMGAEARVASLGNSLLMGKNLKKLRPREVEEPIRLAHSHTYQQTLRVVFGPWSLNLPTQTFRPNHHRRPATGRRAGNVTPAGDPEGDDPEVSMVGEEEGSSSPCW